jgi:peptidyl-prolyl cis-trans isomerase SurA
MGHYILTIGLAVTLTGLLLGIRPAEAQRTEFIDRIVSVVNDDVILSSDLARELFAIRDQLKANNTPLPSSEVLERQVLERLIMTRLQIQEANRIGLRVDEPALNTAVGNIAAQNKLSLTQFRATLEEGGYNFGQFRERIRGQMLIERLRRRQIETRVSVPEREIDNVLANEATRDSGNRNPELLLAQILFELPDGAAADEIEQVQARASEVLERVRAGEDFAEMAVSFSNGRNALEGGQLGWRKLSELPAAFAEALRDLEEGDSSELVRSGAGFHIVKVVQRRSKGRVVIEQTKAQHVLARPGELATEEEVIQRLQQLRDRLLQGDEFGPIARSHSDDRGSALRGGDLGWLSPGDTVPAFERQMALLAPGEISEPFRSQFGWHIVQVVERRNHDGTDAVRRTRAMETIRRRKSEEELQTWQRQLRDEAYVEIRLDRTN